MNEQRFGFLKTNFRPLLWKLLRRILRIQPRDCRFAKGPGLDHTTRGVGAECQPRTSAAPLSTLFGSAQVFPGNAFLVKEAIYVAVYSITSPTLVLAVVILSKSIDFFFFNPNSTFSQITGLKKINAGLAGIAHWLSDNLCT